MTEVNQDIKVEVKIKEELEGQTILHCMLKAFEDTYIRIWPQAVLIDNNNKHYKLITAEKIPLHPYWAFRPIVNGYIHFTLIFEKLSKDCSYFILDEQIPEPNGFYTSNITKNGSGVYTVEVFT